MEVPFRIPSPCFCPLPTTAASGQCVLNFFWFFGGLSVTASALGHDFGRPLLRICSRCLFFSQHTRGLRRNLFFFPRNPSRSVASVWWVGAVGAAGSWRRTFSFRSLVEVYCSGLSWRLAVGLNSDPLFFNWSCESVVHAFSFFFFISIASIVAVCLFALDFGG